MTEWRRRLNRLPVLFHYVGARMSLRDDECIEGDLKHAHYIGTREYVPAVGVKYTISISGAHKGREQIVRQLVEELGTPEIDNCTEKSWIFFWPSNSQEIPKTRVHALLGDERMVELMDEFQLSGEERRLVNVSLTMLAYTMGMEWERRQNYIFAVLAEAQPERVSTIPQAVLKITTEFAKKRQELKAQKKARRKSRGGTRVAGDEQVH